MLTGDVSPMRRRATTHGLSSRTAKHPLYGTWAKLVRRCTAPADENFASYGGRGISVADRWRGVDGFPNFIADVGTRPLGASLDRIDVNGNYEPGNVRWATPKQQARNKRNSKISYETESLVRSRLESGERQADIARSLGVDSKRVYTIARSMRQAEVSDPGFDAMALAWGVL